MLYNKVVGILLLFVLEEQFICSKRRLFWCTVLLITCPSAHLLVVIFVDSIHLHCYCRCYCCFFVCFCFMFFFVFCIFHFVDCPISPHQVGVPCSFQFEQLQLKFGTYLVHFHLPPHPRWEQRPRLLSQVNNLLWQNTIKPKIVFNYPQYHGLIDTLIFVTILKEYSKLFQT